MGLKSKILEFSCEAGNSKVCYDKRGHSLTWGQEYVIIEHLMDEDTHENFYVVTDDEGSEVTVSERCFSKH